MGWRIWKRIFCAVVIAAAIGRALPSRFQVDGEPPNVTIYEYDSEAKPRPEEAPAGPVTYEYDALGRVRREVRAAATDGVAPPTVRLHTYLVPAEPASVTAHVVTALSTGLELPIALVEAIVGARRVPRYWLAFVGWALVGAAAAGFIAWHARRSYPGPVPVVAWATCGFLAPVVVLPLYQQFRPYDDVVLARQ